MISAALQHSLVATILAGLTPTERWQAAGRFNTSFMAEKWFMYLGLAAIVTLTASFFYVNRQRRNREEQATHGPFYEQASKHGLSEQEQQLLLEIALLAGLKKSDSVFALVSAFDRGSSYLIETMISRKGLPTGKDLRSEIASLREKLGFKIQKLAYYKSSKHNRLSTRQIPEGKTIYLTATTEFDDQKIEARITRTDDFELTVETAQPVKVTFGQIWRARYYFGTSVWEFDTTVLGSDQNTLVLRHSDKIRFINRRRFARVPTDQLAWVAVFPFVRESQPQKHNLLTPPDFVQATLTEIAGPGLRLIMPIKPREGDRLITIFDIAPDNANEQNLIIQDIAEVRHVEICRQGYLVAIELVALSDADLNRLVTITNSIQSKAQNHAEDFEVVAARED